MFLAGLRPALLAAGVCLAALAPASAQDAAPPDLATMERWAKDLDSEDQVRIEDAFTRFRAAGAAGVPVLVDVLRRGTDRAAMQASVLLSSDGIGGPDELAIIEEVLLTRSPLFGVVASRALWLAGRKPEKCLPRLRQISTGSLAASALVWRMTGEEGHLRRLLAKYAGSEEPNSRYLAAHVLVEYGSVAGKEFAFRIALPLASDAQPFVRAPALQALTAVDPTAPELLAEYESALGAEPPVVRFQGVRGLAARGLGKPGVLAVFARTGPFRGGRTADWATGALLNGSRSTVEQLAKDLAPMLAHEDLETRVGAALLASALGDGTPEMARALADGLANAQLRRVCLSALTVLGEPAAAAAGEIARHLQDPDEAMAMGAADLLLALGKSGAAAAPAVARALEDARPQLRKAAANLILTVYGTASVPDLEERLKGLDPAKNPEAARVLRKVRGLPDDAPPVPRGRTDKRDIAALVKELKDAPVRDRQLVLRRIASVGLEASAALPTILAILDDPADSISRGDALIALAAVAPTDPKTPERIGPYLIGNDGQLKSRAVQALVRLGPHQPRAAVAYLLDSVERDPELRLEASMALARIGAASVDFLRARLGHADPEVRLWLIRALGEIGPAAKDAAPEVEKACGDADARVKDAAAKALKKIRG